MSIYYGNQEIDEVYYGNQKVSEIYYGNRLIYQSLVPQEVDISGYNYDIDSRLRVKFTKYTGTGVNPKTPNIIELT